QTAPRLQPRLHSLPTRRSSDLAMKKPASTSSSPKATKTGKTKAAKAAQGETPAVPWQANGLDLENYAPAYFTFVATKLASGAAADRKSTRLNSSHVKTSYAVCC